MAAEVACNKQHLTDGRSESKPASLAADSSSTSARMSRACLVDVGSSRSNLGCEIRLVQVVRRQVWVQLLWHLHTHGDARGQ